MVSAKAQDWMLILEESTKTIKINKVKKPKKINRTTKTQKKYLKRKKERSLSIIYKEAIYYIVFAVN